MSDSVKAFIAVDLVNDFVEGKFGSARSVEVAEKAAGFLRAVKGGIIIFTRDSHIKDDPEFRVWGDHCLDGAWGSELHISLKGINGHDIKKRHFDAFYDSDLDGYLRANNVRDVFIFGISTDICVLHTAAGAFFRNYRITVIEDLCAAISDRDHEKALYDMKRNYGARMVKSEEVL